MSYFGPDTSHFLCGYGPAKLIADSVKTLFHTAADARLVTVLDDKSHVMAQLLQVRNGPLRPRYIEVTA